MFKRIILPALLLTLTVVTSCSKSNNAEPQQTPKTIRFEASSIGEFDVSVGAQAPGGGIIFLETTTSKTSFLYETNKLNTGDFVAASLAGATAADIPATLKIDGVNIAPNIDRKDDKGNTVKTWQFTVK